MRAKDFLDWAKWFEKRVRILKQETLPNGYWVSTVFIGMNHDFFQTMVFKPRFATAKVGDKKYNLREKVDEDRYVTYEMAEVGHKIMIGKWLLKKKI